MESPLIPIDHRMDFSRIVTSAAGLSRSGVLTPLLMLTAIICLPALILGSFTSGIFQIFCMGIVAVIIVALLIVYIVFAVLSPNRLHSEQYQISAQGYDLLGDERLTPEARKAVIENVPAIMNPKQNLIPVGRKK